ncbi:MAG: group II truncated hemoglobin [Porticoccaceae bacterium]
MQLNKQGYGEESNSYQAAGELAGITRLVDSFYENMNVFSEAKTIRRMHPEDLRDSRRKLTYFLSGWLGGPKLYSQHYGGISIPNSHRHLVIGDVEGDAWLSCMEKAIADQPYEESFKAYLLTELKVPVGRIKAVCAENN